MREYKTRKLGKMICFLWGLLCFVLMAACGRRDGYAEKENGSKESSVGYVAEYTEGSIQGEIRSFHFCGGVLYRSEQEGAISKLYRCGTESENSSDEMLLSLEKGESLLDFALLSDGRIVAAILKRSDAKVANEKSRDVKIDEATNEEKDFENDFVLRLYDSTGVYLQDVAVPEMEGSHAFARLRVSEGDKIVLALDHSACMLKEDGTILWLDQGLDFLVMGVYALEDGSVILTEMSGQGMSLNSISAGGQMTRQTGAVPSYLQVVDSETGLYAAGNGCLYKVEENGNRIEVLSLAAQGIASTSIEAVSKTADTYGLCLYDRSDGNTFRVATLQEKEGAIEKTVLTIATTDEFIAKGAMGSFNMRSKTHRVISKEYTDDIQMRNAQIDASMLTEDAPDLVCMMGQERYENYAGKGALLDVTDLVPREDYLERTLEDFMVDGKIYGMPMYFSVQTLWCASEDLKGKTSWNVSEFLDFMEEHPNAYMEPTWTPETGKEILLRFALKRGIYEFVDFENGVAFFDSESFRSVLRRINGLRITAVTESKLQRSMRGETILWCDNLSNMSSLPYIAAKAGAGREFTLIGFPDGKHGSGGVFGYSPALGVNAKTKEPEAAREFFGDWLRSGSAWSKFTFPITRQGFEEVIRRGKEAVYQKDAEGNLLLDEDGNPVEEGAYWPYSDEYSDEKVSVIVYAMTDEQEEMLREAVDGSIGQSKGEKTILSIVNEEAQVYFAGQIGLDATVDKMQKRVQLFLEERK